MHDVVRIPKTVEPIARACGRCTVNRVARRVAAGRVEAPERDAARDPDAPGAAGIDFLGFFLRAAGAVFFLNSPICRNPKVPAAGVDFF